jgi:ABC-type lipoprotein release transport system permease subunit
MIQRLFLFIREIFSGAFISFIVFMVIMISVFATGIFSSLEDGVNAYVTKRFATAIPPDTIRVSPGSGKSFLFFEVRDKDSRELDEEALRRIRSIPGVTGLEALLPATIPMQALISLFGLSYRTDLLAIGAPLAMVRDDISSPFLRRQWNSGDYGTNIPVLIPESVLEAYNEGMAGPNGLPRISKEKAVGISFRLRVGYSSLKSFDNYIETTATVAGVTEKVNSLGLIIPVNAAARYNRMFSEDYREKYLSAQVRARDHASMLSVSSSIKKMGFKVEADRTVSEQILSLKRTISAVFGSLRYLIAGLCVIAVSFSTMIATRDRGDYYRIMRIVGASRLFITALITVKYLIIGLAGSACAVILMQQAGARIAAMMPSMGIPLTISMPLEAIRQSLLAGCAILAVSMIPSIIRLYTDILSAD